MTEQTCRVADFIADFIAAKGIEDVFLLPGGGAMYLVDAVGQQPDLNVVACLHEQAVTIAAEAYGRIHPAGIGIAMVTTGPGATNAVTAVAGAWIESVPLVVISGQVKRADMLDDAPLRQKGVQEVNIVEMVKGVTKYANTVVDAKTIRYELEKAFYQAKQGRGGPVWLDIPLDIQAAIIEPVTLKGFDFGLESTESSVSELESVISQTLDLLAQAQRPLILAGHGVRLAGVATTFKTLVEQLGVPVATTWNALDLLPYQHPLAVGRPGVVALRGANFAVQNCDLLISIGCRLDNIITAYNPQGFARAAKKIVIDVDQHEIDKLDMPIELALAVDAKKFIQALQQQTNTTALPSFNRWCQHCQQWKERYPVESKPVDKGQRISHYALADALSEVIPENTLVSTGSSGLAVEIFYTIFRNKLGQRVFLTSGLGAMGYGLPAAIGACFAQGQQPMVAVESDGSLQLNIQELATLKAFNLPICLVVMNNQGYCSIRNTQRNYFNENYVGTGPETGLFLPQLSDLAQTYQLGYQKLSSPIDLVSQLEVAMQQDWPMILEVELVADEVLSPKVAALPQADGSMLSMPLEDMSPLLSLEQLTNEMLIPLMEQSIQARESSTN